MKRIFLVRHGETADNRRWIHQSINVHLSEKGKQEAEKVARAFANTPIDTIITSDAVRARETAAPLAEVASLTLLVEPLLREMHRGVLIEGRHHLSWSSIKGSVLIFFRSGSWTWHFGNGENTLEFRGRLKRILEMLAQAPGDTVVVVTHRGVINGLKYCLRHGFGGSPYLFILGAVLGGTRNGSITELTYDPERETPWKLERVNDRRHLHSL